MTVAPPYAIRPRSSFLHVILGLLALGACSGGAESRVAKTGGPASEADRKVMESAGEVVIAPPAAKYQGGPVTGGGSVTGTLAFASPPAPEAPVPGGKDAAVCGALIPDSAGGVANSGLGNALVWLDGVRKGKPVSLEKRIELESDHCVLIPRVQAAFAGGAVNVIAHDEFRQHLRFIAGGEDAPRAAVLLGKDEQVIPTELPLKTPGLVIVRDLDHEWPRAYVAVFDHPYFAVTKPDGSFTIDQVPPGSYTLVAWHERAGRVEQKVTVTANTGTSVTLQLTAKR